MQSFSYGREKNLEAFQKDVEAWNSTIRPLLTQQEFRVNNQSMGGVVTNEVNSNQLYKLDEYPD